MKTGKHWQQYFGLACAFMLHVDAWILFSHSEMPPCQRIRDVWLWQNIFQIILSHCFFFFFGCSPEQRHTEMYTGVICDLGRSLVNTVLLHWSCQSHSQSVSLRRKKTLGGSKDTQLGEDRAAVRQEFPAVNLKPQNCSNDAGSLQRPAGWNWAREEPNATLSTVLVNYHKWRDDLEKHFWTLQGAPSRPYYWCK